jgi:hypothetical protein
VLSRPRPHEITTPSGGASATLATAAAHRVSQRFVKICGALGSKAAQPGGVTRRPVLPGTTGST